MASGSISGSDVVKLTANVKVAPSPSSLFKLSVAPISKHSSLAIVKPRPVPPNFREVELSAWVNALNKVLCWFFSIPMPVSDTEMLSFTLLADTNSVSISSVTLPSLVNLIALLHKLSSICSMRIASPKNQVSTGKLHLRIHSMFLFFALCSNIVSMRVTSAFGSNAMDSSIKCCDSIFEISRTSLIRFNRLFEEE